MNTNFKDRCYVCNSTIEHLHQVKIINENTGKEEIINCCCLEHAWQLMKENAKIHKSRYEEIINQHIKKIY